MSDLVEVVGKVHTGGFYRCRNGVIVGPIIDTGTWRVSAALGCDGACWDVYGWSKTLGHWSDLVEEVLPPLTWTGDMWQT
jgi:hypothetical protein